MKKKFLTQKRLWTGLVVLAMSLTMLPITSIDTKAAAISNPKIKYDSSMESEQKVTWDCIWFGSYPQTEIVAEKSQCGTEGTDYEWYSDYKVDAGLYGKLQKASYNANGDVTLDGVKYRRIKKDEATYTENRDGYYNWSDDSTYHYFRYDKIKWRVLSTDGSTAFLLADVALDSQRYNTTKDKIIWENSTIRSWLNGYDASSNTYGTDYSTKNFIDSAFSSAQQEAIESTTVVNAGNIYYESGAGNDTTDKIFLLSEAEAYKEESFGFALSYQTYDEARRSKSSTYAKAMGTWSEYGAGAEYDGKCDWWLRTSGSPYGYAVHVFNTGRVHTYGLSIDTCFGVRPAIILDLSSTNLYSNAGTVNNEKIEVIPFDGTIGLSKTQFSYNGAVQKPILYAADEEGNVLNSNLYEITWSDASSKAVGTYNAYVEMKDIYSGSKSLSYSINCNKPSVSSIKAGSKKFAVKLKQKPSAKGGDYYQVAYKKTTAKSWTITTFTGTSKTIKGLKKGKKYQVKVRTNKTISGTKYPSSWTSVKTIKIK